jgi:hypothetical protein
MMDACVSSSNTSVLSGTQNIVEAIATKTSGWLRFMEGRRARGLIRMVVLASKLSERQREEVRWVRERGVRERERERERRSWSPLLDDPSLPVQP